MWVYLGGDKELSLCQLCWFVSCVGSFLLTSRMCLLVCALSLSLSPSLSPVLPLLQSLSHSLWSPTSPCHSPTVRVFRFSQEFSCTSYPLASEVTTNSSSCTDSHGLDNACNSPLISKEDPEHLCVFALDGKACPLLVPVWYNFSIVRLYHFLCNWT